MTGEAYLNGIPEMKTDVNKVKKIQEVYETVLPDTIQKILSNNDEPVFLDSGIRILSFDEIVAAEEELHTDFKTRGILPLADCGENDFIVYHFKEQVWSKFNINDEIIFKRRKELKELLG